MTNVFSIENTRDPEMGITLFPDHKAMSFKAKTLLWSDIKRNIRTSGTFPSKATAPWLKLATFNGVPNPDGVSYRYDKGITSLSGVECDYDEGGMSPSQARDLLHKSEVLGFIYTTGSHTEEAPRWRLLMPFAYPVTGDRDRLKGFRSQMIRRAEGVLGIKFAVESHTLSQAYYFGAVEGARYEVYDITGMFIDSRYDLDTVEDSPLKGQGATSFKTLNRDEAVGNIRTGKSIYPSLLALSASMAHEGYESTLIETFLTGAMELNPVRDDRWKDRNQRITGLVATAIRKYGAAGDNAPKEAVRFGVLPITQKDLRAASEANPFHFILESLLPATAMGIAGAGGSNKSTMTLWIMLHIVTGRAVFGKQILKSSACVFVSAEDEREMIVHRVKRMCDALEFNELEMGLVADLMFIEDVTGTVCRLVEAERDGNLKFSNVLDELIEGYKSVDVAWVVFDPMTYFGAGERFVNDGEALLMSAARKISKALSCATGFIHHVGKESGREKKMDQYAGRGGSAFADNSRAMWNFARYEGGDKGVGVIPDEVVEALEEGKDITRMKISKMSYGRLPKATLWIVRESDWGFSTYWSTEGSVEKTTKRSKEAEEAYLIAVVNEVRKEVVRLIAEGEYPTKRALEGCAIFSGGKTVVRQKLRDAMELGIVKNMLQVVDLPEHLVRGGRKFYIDVLNYDPRRDDPIIAENTADFDDLV